MSQNPVLRAILLSVTLGLSGVALSACDEGPAEEAGEAIDEAVEDAKDAVK